MTNQNPLAETIPEAVKATGMSRTWIYGELKCGRLAALKAGRRTLIPYSQLVAYLADLPAYEPGA